MEHISKHLENQPQSDVEAKQRNGSKVKYLSKTDIANFWAAMGDIFGRTWADTYGSHPTGLWVDQLSKLTKKQLELGQKVIFDLALDFPPNLIQFIKYCTEGMPHDSINNVVRPRIPWASSSHPRPKKSLQHKKTSEELALKYRAKLKEMVNK